NDWALWAPLPVTLNEDLLNPSTKDYGFTGTTGISITSSSEHPEEAFDFLDWMASEEAQILTNWGIEGENYVIEDGKRVQTDEDRENMNTNQNYSLETGVGMYVAIPTNGDRSCRF